MKRVAVIGHGYVGKALVNFFKDHFEVIARDIKKEHLFKKGVLVEEKLTDDDDWVSINKADLAIISVPTPMNHDGRVDCSFVEKVIEKLSLPLILIKSTIPPGTTASLVQKTAKRIVFSPEYIGEGSYVVQWWKDRGYPHPTDMKYHDFQIFGGERGAAAEVLQFFKKVLGPDPRYILTDSTTAELCKYMENAWAAAKVTFCNEFYEISKTFGVNYDELRELWLLDGRVERMHTAVFVDKRGFGGKCLPKDVHGIVHAAREVGYEAQFLKGVLQNNERFLSLNN